MAIFCTYFYNCAEYSDNSDSVVKIVVFVFAKLVRISIIVQNWKYKTIYNMFMRKCVENK